MSSFLIEQLCTTNTHLATNYLFIFALNYYLKPKDDIFGFDKDWGNDDIQSLADTSQEY